MNKLQGKVALITGGSSGIGLATAKLFYEEGATVIITGRNQSRLDEAIQGIGIDSIGIQSDTAQLSEIESLFGRIQDQYGRIDVLFLNAGIARFQPIETITEADYDQIMDTNLKGLYFSIQKALPLFNPGASIILTTSVTNQKGMPNSSVYSASKAAVRSLARTLSAELVERGIRVNALSPGPVDTPIFDTMGLPAEMIQQVKSNFEATTPMNRMGSPDEIAKAALFLAAQDASFMLGSELVVDGGISQL